MRDARRRRSAAPPTTNALPTEWAEGFLRRTDTKVCRTGSTEWVRWSGIPELVAHVATEPVGPASAVSHPAVSASTSTAENLEASAKPRRPARAPPWLWLALGAGVLVVGGLVAGLVLVARNLAAELASTRESLDKASSRLDEQASAIAAAATDASAMSARIDDLKTRAVGMSSAVALLAEHTEGVGYYRLGWEYSGIGGVTSLSVTARPTSEKSCRVAGHFQYSNRAYLPSNAKARLFRAGGEQVYETTVDLSEAAFSFEAPVRCEELNNIIVSR